MPKVFISHSTKDRLFVEKNLLSVLRQNGIETWYSNEDIHTAETWERMIRKGLEECDWFLVVLTKNAVKSKWVSIEVHWALDKRKHHVIPLFLSQCNPDDINLQLSTINYVDFRKDKSAGLKALLKIWGKGLPLLNDRPQPVAKKKKVLVPLMIFAAFLITIVLVFLFRRNTDITGIPIKASNGGLDSARIWLANDYYNKGLDSNVITIIQPLALKGDTGALKLLGNSQYNIGLALYNKRELKQAFEFFNKSAANNNNARAECMLGIMYGLGQGATQKDYKRAFEWLVKSSCQKNDYAKLWLGVFYMKGYGVEKNIDTANKYFNWVVKKGGKATSDEARKDLAELNQNRDIPLGT